MAKKWTSEEKTMAFESDAAFSKHKLFFTQ